MFRRAAGERRDRSGQLRERRDVVGLLVRLTREDRRKPETCNVLCAVRIDARLPHDAVDAGEGGLVLGATSVQAVETRRDEMTRSDQLITELPMSDREVSDELVGHVNYPRSARTSCELFARIRSLETMSAGPYESRSNRPIEAR